MSLKLKENPEEIARNDNKTSEFLDDEEEIHPNLEHYEELIFEKNNEIKGNSSFSFEIP